MLDKKTRYNLEKYQRRAAKKIQKYREEKEVMPEQKEKLKYAKEKMEEGKIKEKGGRTKEAYQAIKQMLDSDELDQKEVEYDEEQVEKIWDAEIKKGKKSGKLKTPDVKKDELLRKLSKKKND